MRTNFVQWFLHALWMSFAMGSLAETWEQSSRSVDRFGFVELTLRLEESPTGNPFQDVTLAGEFQRENETPRKVDGFCDDATGRIHRVRFMPVEAGQHRFRVVAQVGRFRSEHEGTFRARAGRRAGVLRVDPEHPQHFVFSGNGRHFFWNATTAYWLLGFSDEARIRKSLDRLAGLGVNRIRTAISGRTRDGRRWREPAIVPTEAFQFRLEPWPAARPADIENPGYDVSRFNVDHFRRIERMLAHASRLGIQVSIIFHLDGRDPGVDPFGRKDMGGRDEQRYYRYVIARLAAFDNVMWDVTNEWHLFRDEAWVEKMGSLIRDRDPYHHLTSVHGRGTFPFRLSPWVDYTMFQSWDEQGGYAFMLRNRLEQAARGRPLPTINEEYGYEDHYPYPWGQARKWPARSADSRRRLAWEMVMAGGYETTGERADVPGYGGWITGRGNEQMTMLAGYAHLRRFFEAFPWWKLEPREDVIRSAGPAETVPAEPSTAASPAPIPVLREMPMCLSQSGVRHVIYLPRGGVASVSLDPGSHRARWFNPRTGVFRAGSTRVNGPSWTSDPAPDAEDWVLLIEGIPRR